MWLCFYQRCKFFFRVFLFSQLFFFFHTLCGWFGLLLLIFLLFEVVFGSLCLLSSALSCLHLVFRRLSKTNTATMALNTIIMKQQMILSRTPLFFFFESKKKKLKSQNKEKQKQRAILISSRTPKNKNKKIKNSSIYTLFFFFSSLPLTFAFFFSASFFFIAPSTFFFFYRYPGETNINTLSFFLSMVTLHLKIKQTELTDLQHGKEREISIVFFFFKQVFFFVC